MASYYFFRKDHSFFQKLAYVSVLVFFRCDEYILWNKYIHVIINVLKLYVDSPAAFSNIAPTMGLLLFKWKLLVVLTVIYSCELLCLLSLI